MKLIKKLAPTILFYLILSTTFFLPNLVSIIIVIIDFIIFIGFLLIINHKANLGLESNKSESFWNLFINLAIFGVIQIVLLYGLIGWTLL